MAARPYCQFRFASHDKNLASRARESIARGDRGEALRLLHALVLGAGEIVSELTPTTTQVLVAVASGASADEDRAALTAYQELQRTFQAIAEQIRATPLEREHLAGLRALLDERERELDDQAEERRRDENGYRSSSSLRRVGDGWLEVKWIPRRNGKATGPYLYYRVRGGGHLRSRYIGKTTTG